MASVSNDVAKASDPASSAQNTPSNPTFASDHASNDHPQHPPPTLPPSSSRATSPKQQKDPSPSRPNTSSGLTPSIPPRLSPALMDTQRDGTPSSPDRPLNVTDALSYLDSVKVQFQDRPDVYNRFLDIMKDFKSQYIDTPGVIERVSNLFHGHPALIQGFNTFLPAGYRIDCTTDSRNPNLITVTTPSGTIIQSTNGSLILDGPNTSYSTAPQIPLSPEADMEPALVYLQKVKTRYANDPERYRRFLELLSPGDSAGALNDDDVLYLVGQIFKGDFDLMKGFYQFLPDRNVQRQAAAKLDEVQGSSKSRDMDQKKKRGEPSSAPAPSTPSLPQKRKRKPVDRENTGKDKDVLLAVGKSAPNKRTKQGHGSDLPSPSLAQRHAAPLSPRRATFTHNLQAGPSSIIIAHHHHHPPSPMGRYDDGQFFDRVKRALDNRETYNEFLKVVNLFTQDIIDSARLVRESRAFLGEGELMAQFKEILGYDERKERIGGVSGLDDVWTRPTGVLDRPSRNQLHERFGSYRKLPVQETNVLCSGRDDMCKSVLNDEWISQPTFASEDAGFIAHKKNVYEEALHRSEEERHEYDFHLEAISRTIQMLEPFNSKISQLSPEERMNYKLKPQSLGGPTKSVHLRVVKKIYGREAGVEVFKAMEEIPAVAIPVVFTRLKEKKEEWKRAQREWNKVWKEVDARNYHKSLDHQAITFKAQDKKGTTSKFFVNQIEVARDEQRGKRAALVDPLFARTRPRYQLEYAAGDEGILRDVVKLVCSFLDRTGDKVSVVERKRVESFLRSFVPVFFMLDPVVFNASFVPKLDGNGGGAVEGEEGESPLEETESVGSSSHSRSGRGGKKSAPSGSGGNGGGSDLRKRLLKSEQAKSSRRTRAAHEPAVASPSSSTRASPAVGDESGSGPSSPTERSARKGTFYTNTTFYVLIRLLELLYSRLQVFKNVAATAAADPSSYKPNPVAQNLGLLNDLGRLGDRAYDAVHFYDLFLESCEKLFDNVLEQHVFEDIMRYMFGVKDAYKAFTVDKVVGSIVKQIQNLLSDPRSQELYDLLRREREVVSPTTQDLLNARKNAEKVLGPDENLFRVDWLPDSKTVTIQLLGKDDSSFDDTEALNGRWQTYIDSYVSPEQTEGVPLSHVARRPFLQRTMPGAPLDTPPSIRSNGSLSMRVCVRTYRLFYVARGEESFWRTGFLGKEREGLKKRATIRRKEKVKWLQKWANKEETVVAQESEKVTRSVGGGGGGGEMEGKTTVESRSRGQSGAGNGVEVEKGIVEPDVVVAATPEEVEKTSAVEEAVEAKEGDDDGTAVLLKEREQEREKAVVEKEGTAPDASSVEKEGEAVVPQEGEDVTMDASTSA